MKIKVYQVTVSTANFKQTFEGKVRKTVLRKAQSLLDFAGVPGEISEPVRVEVEEEEFKPVASWTGFR